MVSKYSAALSALEAVTSDTICWINGPEGVLVHRTSNCTVKVIDVTHWSLSRSYGWVRVMFGGVISWEVKAVCSRAVVCDNRAFCAFSCDTFDE